MSFVSEQRVRFAHMDMASGRAVPWPDDLRPRIEASDTPVTPGEATLVPAQETA